MAATLETVMQDALVLPVEERLVLARQILESVDGHAISDADEGWDAVIARRLADYRAGRVKLIPAREVFARLREIAPEP